MAGPSLAGAASIASAIALVALGAWIWVVPAADLRAAAAAATGLATGTTFPVRLRTLRARITARIGLGPASRRRQAQERLLVIRALGALAAELESGQPIGTAMRRAGGDPSVWPVSVGALQMDGDVASALATDALRHPVLLQLAACWQVGADSGAGLAAAVARLAASARGAEDVRVDLEGQLAGPRASARMLAVLPFVGIGFGMMLGSDPLSWLLTSVAGRLCLLAGLSLTALGTWWTGRIALRVERML